MENTLEQLLMEEHQKSHGAFKVGLYVVIPIYWGEDDNENIEYDTESMREEFDGLLYELEQHNENTVYSWEEE